MNTFENNMISYKSLQDSTYDIIKFHINIGKIMPGEILSERKLASQYNVSRTPVRNALLRLQTEGLLESDGVHPYVVKFPSIEDIEEIGMLYVNLSNLMAKNVIRNITTQDIEYLEELVEQIERFLAEDRIYEAAGVNFDFAVWEMSGMTDTIAYAKTLPQYWKHKCIQPYIDMEKKKKNIMQHCVLAEYLKDKNYEGFRVLFDHHIKDTLKYTVEAFEKYYEAEVH